MKLFRTATYQNEFEPLVATRSLQAAMMTLAKGGVSDEEVSNEHPSSEQWLYVISGQGTAIIGSAKKRHHIQLRPGMLLVVERGEPHQIQQRGRRPLRTIDFYAPPAYRANGSLRAER